jgi:hypothetical protein
MSLDVLNKCPRCGLVLLHGAILDAAAEVEQYGPILRLDRNARTESAKAGYIGISSLFDPVNLRESYRCPRCGADPIIEIPETQE